MTETIIIKRSYIPAPDSPRIVRAAVTVYYDGVEILNVEADIEFYQASDLHGSIEHLLGRQHKRKACGNIGCNCGELLSLIRKLRLEGGNLQ